MKYLTDKESSMKTPLLGNANLSDIFEDFGFYPWKATPGHGSRTLAPTGYYFISTPGCIRPKHNLFGKPTAKALEAAQNNATDGSVGSFGIIPWADKALVIAIDRHHIAQPWIAFIPLDQIPDTETIPEREL